MTCGRRRSAKKLKRRDFLKRATAATAALAWASLPSWVRAAAKGAASSGKVLVVVFLRGAADALNVVVPFRDGEYRKARPTLALPEPGREGGVLDLDGDFGLHPALAPLVPSWKDRSLAVVRAVGSPEPNRSHFDAQDFMESGTPGVKSTRDGWLNRALASAAPADPLAAVAFSTRPPRILRGSFPAVSLPSLRDFRLSQGEASRPAFLEAYGDDPLLSRPAETLVEAERRLQALSESAPPTEWSRHPFERAMADTARLIRAERSVRVVFVDYDGWDHHHGQDWRLTAQLAPLARGLASLKEGLGSRWNDTAVVTLTEFGRTLRENGARGTDHGRGGFSFVMGGRVRGGRLYGSWPGLEPEALEDGRDLAVATDFRDLCGELLTGHLELKDPSAAFPGHRFGPKLGLV